MSDFIDLEPRTKQYGIYASCAESDNEEEYGRSTVPKFIEVELDRDVNTLKFIYFYGTNLAV